VDGGDECAEGCCEGIGGGEEGDGNLLSRIDVDVDRFGLNLDMGLLCGSME
jgi:hypothetical protein